MRSAQAVPQRVPRATRRLDVRSLPAGTLVLAAAVPFLFLEFQYQPDAVLHLGSARVDAYLSDWALLAVVVAAVVRGVRDGFGVLARGRALWATGLLLFAWILVEVVHGKAYASSYPLQTHGVTAAKFAEYALLAPAVPLLVRSFDELRLVLWTFVAWSGLATVAGLAQFFGADVFGGGAAGHRQASFLSSADFAALSGAALLVGVAAFAVPSLGLGRRLAAVALATGVVGTIVAGSVAAVLGILTALVVLGVLLLAARELEARRAVAVVASAALVVAGTVAIRSSDLEAFSHFLGASTKAAAPAAKVQTYPHRTLLSWIGYRIWTDHPLIGIGWEASGDPAGFEPYLAAAHRRFPSEAPSAFPSAAPGRQYGVQDAWLQSLADLGVVGFALWTAVFAAAAWLAVKAWRAARAPAGLVALLWICLLVWLWTAEGFVAGIPLDALTWLAFGLAATSTGAVAQVQEPGSP
jgi:O-antigen ligase